MPRTLSQKTLFPGFDFRHVSFSSRMNLEGSFVSIQGSHQIEVDLRIPSVDLILLRIMNVSRARCNVHVNMRTSSETFRSSCMHSSISSNRFDANGLTTTSLTIYARSSTAFVTTSPRSMFFLKSASGYV